jgi:hypothetical protein
MDPIDYEFGHQYGEQQRKERYNKRNAARRKIRLEEKKMCCFHSPTAPQYKSSIIKQNTEPIIQNDDTLYADQQLADIVKYYSVICTSPVPVEENDYDISIVLSDVYDETETIPSDDDYVSPIKLPLHNYTMDSTYDYCEAFTIVARQANLSKTSTNNFLSLIKSGLPTPNQLPSTEEELLLLLGVDNLFIKRSICLLCCEEFDYREKNCSQCRSTDKNSIAYV